jgi:hypothetical protein
MPVTWENDGQPVDGEYIATITFEDGSQPQRFKGQSYKQVADALLAAQENASRAIKNLRAGQQIEPARPRKNRQPKPMTPGERLGAVADLQDPNKADKAITRIVEATVGPVEAIREAIDKTEDEEAAAEAAAETKAFVDATPEWYPTDYNKQTLVNYMAANSIAPTRKNFSICFSKLLDAGLLQRKPAETGVEPEPEPGANGKPNGSGLPHDGGLPPAPRTRPRGTLVTTGIRAEDTSGSPRPPRPRYTKDDIEKMPNALYRQKLDSEPGFSALVDSLYK